MAPDALIPLMLALGVCLGGLIAVALYALDLARIAALLDERERDPRSNARITAGSRAPGMRALIDAINRELDRSAQAHVSAVRHQHEFQRDLSAFSHDIRTPLTGAKGYLQLAAGEDDAPARTRHLAAATTRIDATAELLDQLFAYTTSTDPDLVLACEPLALQPLVEAVLLGHYPAFEERGWEPGLRFADPGARVEGNREALTRIVENLVVNAIRHGASAPVIEQATGGSETVALTIANRVNHPEALDAERLFDRFYQADAARGTAGSGLGLAVAANLARAMGGTLTAHLEGNVLAFKLTLPSA